MKKLFITFISVLASVCFSIAGKNEINLKTGLSAHDYPLDNGLIIRGSFGITRESYFLADNFQIRIQNLDKYDNDKPDYFPTITFGLEIGHQWYLWSSATEKMGIAINANWFDIQFGVGVGDKNYVFSNGGKSITSTYSANSILTNMALFEFGPLYTYVINDDIGIDAYLNLRPTFLMSRFTYEDIGDADGGATGFGLTYAAGASFRWRALLFGLEYGFGKVNMIDSYYLDYEYKVYTGLFKINIGIKL